MHVAFPGLGTVINIVAVVAGALLGMWVGHRIPERTRSVVTDCLGLTTLLVAGLSTVSVTDAALRDAVGPGVPVLVVLGSLLIGSITGSTLRIEERLAGLAGILHERTARRRGGQATKAEGGASAAASGDRTATTDAVGDAETHADADAARERFIEGWLSASLLFCVGPLAILGSLSDGLGRGIDQLTLKSVLDGFAALAFASSFGVGVLLSAVSVGVVQGLWTVLGVVLGSLLPDAHIAALTATGGLLLVGIGLRLLRIRDVPVGDMLPALLFAPLLTQAIIALR